MFFSIVYYKLTAINTSYELPEGGSTLAQPLGVTLKDPPFQLKTF